MKWLRHLDDLKKPFRWFEKVIRIILTFHLNDLGVSPRSSYFFMQMPVLPDFRVSQKRTKCWQIVNRCWPLPWINCK